MRKRTSIIWKSSKNEFKQIVKKHNSLADILRYLGLHAGAGNYRTLKTRIKEENINISHIKLGIKSNIGRTSLNKKPASHYLYKGSKIKSYSLKLKLIDEEILENKCSECGQGPKWNNKKLSLQLDHINGESSDNRLENLRILCPNCHSQTDTYSGKKLKKHHNCSVCQKSITKGANMCKPCSSNKNNKTKNKVAAFK